MTVYTGRITKLEIGASAESHTDVTNVKFMGWDRIHNITPRLLPSSKIPVGWLQGHSWLKGEIRIVSEMTSALSGYYSETADSTIIPYVMATYVKQDGTTATCTFTGFIVFNVKKSLEEGSESVYVYEFLAYNSTEA